ncbi:YegP family protein (plasmid) [Variovorax sp. V213]|uniref:YegP family protein n=1 Tax=Variovorax sp. V213 TaxID=3065955 RepID=UPI0034E8DFD6
MSAYFHLKPSGTQYMFNLKGGNGEVVLTSERYTTKQSAEGGIASVKVNSPHDARYDRRTNSGGSPYFVLKAGNGEIIGTSEAYSSTTARDSGIAWVKAHAPTAPTRE